MTATPTVAMVARTYVTTGARFDEVMPLVMQHHYSKRRTADPRYCFAVREPGGLFGDTGDPVAAMIFTSPINKYFSGDVVELSRLVRVPQYDIPLSAFIAFGLRWMKRNTEVDYAISYADTAAGHHGGIYQASNWVYLGASKGNVMWKNETTGALVSGRSFDQRRPQYRDGWLRERTSPKHLYLYPLNKTISEVLKDLKRDAKPYPKPSVSDAIMEVIRQ